MSKGLILKDSAHKTTLHKNARKYTQKISNTRILLLIIRLLRLFLVKNNIKVTFGVTFRPANHLNRWTQQKKQPMLHNAALPQPLSPRTWFLPHTLHPSHRPSREPKRAIRPYATAYIRHADSHLICTPRLTTPDTPIA